MKQTIFGRLGVQLDNRAQLARTRVTVRRIRIRNGGKEATPILDRLLKKIERMPNFVRPPNVLDRALAPFANAIEMALGYHEEISKPPVKIRVSRFD
ncbi:MAG: hypothetical protein ABII22_04260 [Candidatus Micrarchaeota archaeon]